MSEQELYNIIADNLKRLMERKSYTQADVAEYLGVSQASVSAWCLAQKMPRMNKIDKLCELLGCTRTELMSKDGIDQLEKRNKNDILQDVYNKHKALFDAAENATEEEIMQTVDYLNYLRDKRLKAYAEAIAAMKKEQK